MFLGSDLLIQSLEKAGVEWAFGIPGGPISSIFHSLSVSKQIRVVLVQHENQAGFMALGSYLFSEPRTVPLVFVTSGPGATNAVTGVASAYEEKVPMFLITGNIATNLIGKRAAQDSFETGINLLQMFSSITAKTVVLNSNDDVEKIVLDLMETAKKTSLPVHLNVPGNVSMEVLSAKKAEPSKKVLQPEPQQEL